LPGFPYSSLSGTLVSYGASAFTRTSDRGHLAEAETNVIEVVMSTFVFSSQHKDAEYSSLVVGVIDSD